MTDIRIGDIVKIERGEEGKPGYLVKVVTVVKGRTCKDSEMPLSEVERHREKSSVTVIQRAAKHRTALAKYDGELTPVIMKSDGKLILPTTGYIRREDLDDDSFIETCPYVPLDLIEEAEEWADSEYTILPRPASAILADIVDAVRKYRDGTP